MKRFETSKEKRLLLSCVSILFSCLIACCCTTVYASDAVRIYLELSNNTATVWPGGGGKEYLRGRAVFLDANNELATTFAGKAITDSQLMLQSFRFGSEVLFSSRPATDLDLTGDWKPAAETVNLNIERAWQEFAVSYDNINDLADNDTLVITLKNGTSTITSQRSITVQAPLANCYVVRTGGLLSLGILDPIPNPKNDGSSLKVAGATTIVDVYAAFYNKSAASGTKYYYTNNLPPEGDFVTITSGSTTADVQLTNGHAQTSLAPKVGQGDDNILSKVNAAYIKGVTATFTAAATNITSTRWVGNESGDVTSAEYINVASSSTLLSEGSSSFKDDNSKYRPNRIVSKITIVGIPVNEVASNGAHKESGFASKNYNPGTANIQPNDAYKLLADKTKKPTGGFKVAGKRNRTYIYGAIAGYDASGNPAPFAQGLTATFFLKKTGGIAVNSTAAEIRPVTLTDGGVPVYYAGPSAGTSIKVKYAYQAFLPFQITATADDGTTPSLSKVYIGDIQLSDGSSVPKSLYADIDEESEGITFIAQDTVGAITMTDIKNLNGKNAGDDAQVQLKGRNDETSFGLRVIQYGGSSLKLGNKGSTSTVTSPDEVSIPAVKDGIAQKDVAFFTATTATKDSPFFFVFSGSTKGTNVIQRYPPYTGTDSDASIEIMAADPSDYAPAGLSSTFTEINAYLDEDQKHNIISLATQGFITVTDMFSNAYGATGVNFEESDVTGELYLPADDGTASDTAFPGASATIDRNTILMKYSLDDIKAGQDTGILKITSGNGALSKEIPTHLKAAKQIDLKNKFVPIPGVTDTPVVLFLADQNGDHIAPVTITAANDTTNKGKYGNSIAVELEADNGTINSAATTTINLTTKAPEAVITALPDENRTSMSILASTKRYGKKTLLLNFEPDFTKPFVGDITASNCRIDIELEDNLALDLEGTEVTIIDPSGEDITDDLTRTVVESDNGTKGIIIFTGFPSTGEGVITNYSIDIIAKDQWGNEREVSRIVPVECVYIPPECLQVSPISGVKGETKTVTIKGVNTNFVQGTTVVQFSCDNATVTATEVKSPTEVVVSVDIKGTAQPCTLDCSPDVAAVVLSSYALEASGTTTTTTTISGDTTNEICDITVTTGAEILSCPQAFTILSSKSNPQCISITPSTIQAGKTVDIVIQGTDTTFTNTTPVSFGCSGGITINSQTANSNTQLTVNITSSAEEFTATTACSVTVGDLTCGELSIQPAGAECKLKKISRKSAIAGYFLPKVFLITITGNSTCSFSQQSAVSFGTSSITALPLITFKNAVVCLVTVNPRTQSGTYDVTVDGFGGVTFTIK